MSSIRRAPTTNRVIEALPRRDRAAVIAACEPVELIYGAVLHGAGGRLRDAWFPLRGFISLINASAPGESLEVGLVGREGLFGIPLALGVDESPLGAVVQGAGSALRMEATAFRRALARHPAFRGLVDRCAFVHLSELAQSSACTRFHVVEARLARWLLMTQDRAQDDTFAVTHAFLGLMLGVRRVGITEAAGQLQRRALIGYRRGVVTVLDRRGLKAAACDCYRVGQACRRRIMDAAATSGAAA